MPPALILGTLTVHLPPLVALAAVAVVGYWIGRGARAAQAPLVAEARRETRRAQGVARELERIAASVQRGLAQHQVRVVRFKDRLRKLRGQQGDGDWAQLCTEAEQMIHPTQRLAAEIAQANDDLRRQGRQLLLLTEVRTDPLTGLSNRAALREALDGLVALRDRDELTFAVALFDLDGFQRVNEELGRLAADRVLQAVARALDATIRGNDMAARLAGDEFVVLMPRTALSAACALAERVRQAVEQETAVTVRAGVAEARQGETPVELLDRADKALAEAKAAGGNTVRRHVAAAPPGVPDDEDAARAELVVT